MQEVDRRAGRFSFLPRVERRAEFDGLELCEALSRLRDRARPVLLDSAAGSPRRFSLLAFDPLPPEPPQDLGGLRAYVRSLVTDPGAPQIPFFAGGFLGALAYDLGVAGEELALPADPWGWPRIVGGLYVDYLLRDHAGGATWLVLAEDPGDGRAALEVRRAQLLEALAQPHPGATEPRPLGPPRRLVGGAEYRDRVERVRAEIARGEIYQANLSHRLERELQGHPVDLYLRLRHQHPGPYLGYVGFEHGGPAALLSGSPELLLAFEPARDGRPGRATTRPIKGTAPRCRGEAEDRASAAHLLASEKDRAELTMIVDLERNDLGRVARAGGVEVGAFPRLESYATVHHLVADVRADIDAGCDAVDVLAALFPGGSVTGAPKLRSMEIIAGLEAEGRGHAYGSLALFDTSGEMQASLLIRTLLWRALPPAGSWRGEASYRIGGGITWASDAAAEERESLVKGEALARSLEGRGEAAAPEPGEPGAGPCAPETGP